MARGTAAAQPLSWHQLKVMLRKMEVESFTGNRCGIAKKASV